LGDIGADIEHVVRLERRYVINLEIVQIWMWNGRDLSESTAPVIGYVVNVVCNDVMNAIALAIGRNSAGTGR
jgi:hypothetical protein